MSYWWARSKSAKALKPALERHFPARLTLIAIWSGFGPVQQADAMTVEPFLEVSEEASESR